jgi:hypothetical protein
MVKTILPRSNGMDWREELAQTVTSLFCEANRKSLPQTLEQWGQVAERFQRDLYVARTSGSCSGVLVDEVIVVKDDSDAFVVGKRFAHELAEYLLRSEWDRPYVYQSSASGDAEAHRIARLVEGHLEEEREAQRVRLEASCGKVAAGIDVVESRIQKILEEMKAMTLAMEDGTDLGEMPTPNCADLRPLQRRLRAKKERLSVIETALKGLQGATAVVR